MGPFVRGAADAAGLSLGVHVPLMANSDHANFAAHGIPALRLLAGFDDPGSNLRHLLTRADTALLTDALELKAGTLTAGAVLWRTSRESDGAEVASTARRTTRSSVRTVRCPDCGRPAVEVGRTWVISTTSTARAPRPTIRPRTTPGRTICTMSA